MPIWSCPFCSKNETVDSDLIGQIGACPSCGRRSIIDDKPIATPQFSSPEMESLGCVLGRCLADDETPPRPARSHNSQRQVVRFISATGRRLRMACPKCNRRFVVRTSPAQCSYCHYIPSHDELMEQFGPLLFVSIILLVVCLVGLLLGFK